MLCVSGFELYSRWLPVFVHIALKFSTIIVYTQLYNLFYSSVMYFVVSRMAV